MGPRRGIRFYRASSQETSDANQAFGGQGVFMLTSCAIQGRVIVMLADCGASLTTCE